MKLNNKMRYPHPVLSEYSSDYVSSEFKCGFEQNVTPGGELRLVSHLSLTNLILGHHISTQSAAAGYFVVCRRTYFNVLQEAPLGDSEKFFDLSQLFGLVTIRPVIWTLRPIEKFSSPHFNSEFGSSVSVGKGSIVALGPEFRFSVDQKKYKPFDSIFELTENAAVKPGTIEIDPDQDRIAITAEGATYKSLADMRNVVAARPILLNAVYMPAVMDVISRLQSGQSGLEGRKWYRVFKAKCDDLAINPADAGQSPLVLAQKLLRAPLNGTISVVEKLS